MPLERFDWRPAAAAVTTGLLVRFGLIGVVDQVLYWADVASHITVQEAYLISVVTFWGATAVSVAAGWMVYRKLRHVPLSAEVCR